MRIFICNVALVAGAGFSDVDFGDDQSHNDVTTNANNNDLIPSTGSDAWQDALDSADDKAPTIEGTLSNTVRNNPQKAPPPSTLIYTCGGTSDPLGYCEFPFTTLAGNTYTNTCADKVEDNPDYTVDRPWCFTSANQWGFCDCYASFSFSYVTTNDARNSSVRDINVQVTINYPGTVWCSLSNDKKTLPTVNQLSAHNSSFIGSSTNVTSELIAASIDSFVQFSATPNFIKAHSYLACQAAIPGLANQPQPLVVTLGVSGSASNGIDGTESASSVPFLVTTTSGALMYSVLIGMILGSFIGARTALDYRRKLLRFSKLETKDPLSPK